MTEGVIVAGAITSMKRKSGYSSWGSHLTVTAPYNNGYYIMWFIPPRSDPRRDLFVANYRGLGQLAASNLPGHGDPFSRISDAPHTTDVRENLFTRGFGGRLGLLLISRVAALML